MRTKEVAEICGVSVQTVVANAREIGKEIKHGVATEWSEEDLKKLQLVLMRNAQNAGGQKTEGSTVKEQCQSTLTVGLSLQVIMDSGNLEALEEFVDFARKGTQAKHDLLLEQQKTKELEEKNKLLIEQKEAAEAETERIFQYNKNFHNHLYTATDLAKMLGTTANRIGRIAKEQNLKQEPVYGKLGKIQLNNGRWVDIFYYNEDAKLVIENNL